MSKFHKKFMLGTKGKMTQVFDEAGVARAATIISAGPLTVVQIKSKEKDGYEATQVGFGVAKAKKRLQAGPWPCKKVRLSATSARCRQKALWK